MLQSDRQLVYQFTINQGSTNILTPALTTTTTAAAAATTTTTISGDSVA